jgi:hypothetical protein
VAKSLAENIFEGFRVTGLIGRVKVGSGFNVSLSLDVAPAEAEADSEADTGMGAADTGMKVGSAWELVLPECGCVGCCVTTVEGSTGAAGSVLSVSTLGKRLARKDLFRAGVPSFPLEVVVILLVLERSPMFMELLRVGRKACSIHSFQWSSCACVSTESVCTASSDFPTISSMTISNANVWPISAWFRRLNFPCLIQTVPFWTRFLGRIDKISLSIEVKIRIICPYPLFSAKNFIVPESVLSVT